MADAAENFDDLTEEQLAEMRGDNIKTDPEQVKEPEDGGKSEGANPEADSGDADTGSSESAESADSGDTSDSGESGAGAEEPEESPRPLMIPKSRYDANSRRWEERNQELQRQIDELQKQQATKQEQAPADPRITRLEEIDTDIAKALADGDGDKAAKLLQESRALQGTLFNEQLKQVASGVSEETKQAVLYDNFLAQVEAARPELNPDSDVYDEAMLVEVAELKESFEARGYPSTKALERALGYVYPGGWNAAPAPAAKEPEKPAPRKTNIDKNLEAASRIPSSQDGGEKSSDGGLQSTIDVLKLTDEEFDKLTEAELAKLRGDEA